MPVTKRQVVQLDVPINNPNLPRLGLTKEELELASIQSISLWPALHLWGVNDANTGFRDRLFDDELLSISSTSVDTRFFQAVDGLQAYSIQNSSMVLATTDFDDSGSFTVALLVAAECGFGSINLVDGRWYVASNGGKLRFEVAGAGIGSYEQYNGPLLTAEEFKSIIFIVDKGLGTVTLRVDGQNVFELDIDKDKVQPGELQIGRINAATPQQRNGFYRAVVTFNDALSSAEISTLEAYLNSLKV